MEAPSFVAPVLGLRPDQCAFYHRLPFEETKDRPWQWDLNGREADYLGGYDFNGKRVLEFGAANGALTFFMDKQGADVVATDLSPDVSKTSWDVLLREGLDLDEVNRAMSAGVRRLNNGFWYARERFGGRANFVHGTAYETPRDIGSFDVVTLCAILLHLRDPLRALDNAISFTRDSIIITDLMPFHLSEAEADRPLAVFLPSAANATAHGGVTWWHISPTLYARYLDIRGFDVVSETYGSYRHHTREFPLFHLIAKRR